jgi:hypothetical protein
MKTPPEVWRKANAERFVRLGAMVTRRRLLMRELSDVSRDIERLQDEIVAIEKTVEMAAEVEESAAKNGETA